MNKLNNYFEIAWKSLTRQKSRTILTIIALSIGIALLIIMLAAGQGLKSLVLSQLDIYNPNTINVEVRVRVLQLLRHRHSSRPPKSTAFARPALMEYVAVIMVTSPVLISVSRCTDGVSRQVICGCAQPLASAM